MNKSLLRLVLTLALGLGLAACAGPGWQTRGAGGFDATRQHPLSECRRACQKGGLDVYVDETIECRCLRKTPSAANPRLAPPPTNVVQPGAGGR